MCAMDAKIDPSRVRLDASVQQASKKRRRTAYIQELKDELKKVSWTTKEELKFATKMVVGATFFLGLGIYLVDLMIKGCLDLIAFVVHFIFG